MCIRFCTLSLLATGLLLFGSGENLTGCWQSHSVAFAQSASEPASTLEADQLVEQGQQQIQNGQLQAAIDLWQRAIEMYRTTGNQQAEAEVLISISKVYHELEQYQAAKEASEQAVAIAQAINNPRLEATALLISGAYDISLEEYSQATENFQQALERSRAADSDDLEARSLDILLAVYLYLNQYQQVTSTAEQALAVAEETNNLAVKAIALSSLGNVYYNLGQYQQAISLFLQALEPAQAVEDYELELNILKKLGSGYIVQGQFQQANDFHQQTLELAREHRNHRAEASALVGLGSVSASLRQLQQANEFYQQALEIAQATNDVDTEIQALLGLGSGYIVQGQFQQANEFYQQALEVANTSDNVALKAMPLVSVGNSYVLVGQYRQAAESFQKALEIAQGEDNPILEATVLEASNILYTALGQYQQVIDSHQRVLEIIEEQEFPFIKLLSLLNLGNVLNSMGEYLQAIQFSEEAVKLANDMNSPGLASPALHSQGLSYLKLGEYSQAINLFQQSIRSGQEIGLLYPNSLTALGVAYLVTGQYPEAIESLQQALEVAQKNELPREEAEALDSLGLIYLNMEEFSTAEPLLVNAIEINDSLRINLNDANQLSLFDTQTDAYSNLQVALVSQDKVTQALEISEQGRARALSNLMSRRLSTVATDQLTSDSLSIEQIRQIAKEQDATLVQYSLIENEIEGDLVGEEIYIWVVKPTGEIAMRKVDAEGFIQSQLQGADFLSQNDAPSPQSSLNASVSRLRTVITNREATSQRNVLADPSQASLLKENYQLLIEPIADLLPTDPNEHVIFIPQGELFSVPFPALQDANGTYLIEKHTILTAPSIQVLGLTHEISQRLETESPQQSDNILVVGNPTMPTIPTLPGEAPLQPPPLPGSEQEALDIAQFFGSQALLGADATETTVVQQMSNARIVHLATHGLLDYGQPREFGVRDIPGAVVLASSSQDDGLLTASEILDLDLRAELVVLSACDTGGGNITGDGVVGLSRSLIAAGTPSVIVSLWQVPDDATAMLMTEFYRQLQQNPDKAQALRQAMLATMVEHPAVRDWAAFTLIGEAE